MIDFIIITAFCIFMTFMIIGFNKQMNEKNKKRDEINKIIKDRKKDEITD
ncbi:Small hydrophobic protein [Campylobacter sputorum subsp. bubulus]|uniref:Small hydrophobic protein n=1 Tax=Campylobacter sputorum subsp. sputorum TaxID=32024 RepID=A0A381DIZ7_9BACT|nr:hypothetical protein [Campylobacter sputorum]SUX08218.1 Small hydrophobic protein [Campylobacter sputorum subsp. bubulus]SUX10497.1 Small hydrophobic protein [Campylobacter sputorum subsp. sputorum]